MLTEQPKYETMYPSDEAMKKTGQVTSRLAKREQKKILQQILLFGGGAVVIIGLFLFLVIPGLARVFNALLGSSSVVSDSNDELPPQVPSLAAPPTATYSATINLKGYGESASEVVVLVNGIENTRHIIAEDGNFSIEVALAEGDNRLTAYAVDAAGNESANTKEYAILIDHQAPKLEISEPTTGQNIEGRRNQTLAIKGVTEPKARVFINGRINFANAEGVFSATYQLQEGENKIMVRAEDEAGNSTQSELIVQFKI